MGTEELLLKYGMPRISRNDLDCRRCSDISLDSKSFRPLKYCSMNVRSLGDTTRLVVIVI